MALSDWISWCYWYQICLNVSILIIRYSNDQRYWYLSDFYRSNSKTKFFTDQRQNFLPIKFQTRRQSTSCFNFMTLLSLDIFKYFTFDYKFIKPSKILIWAIGKFYRSNFTRPKTKDRTFYRSNFRPKDKPLPFWFFWWFFAQTCFLPHFWV